MATRWNARPAYTEKPLLGSYVTKTAALQSVASYAAVALIAALTSRYGYVHGENQVARSNWQVLDPTAKR